MHQSDTTKFTIALAGDIILTRRLSIFREPEFLAIREIFQQVDAVFANLEAPVHRYRDGGFADTGAGGSYVTTEPHLLEDLKWLGVQLVASGSSHADDYGPSGILKTLRYLDKAGIAHAGSGEHLAAARAPAFLDTPNGRLGLVAAMAPHSPTARAGEQRRDVPGYPGINTLRHRTLYEVEAHRLEALQAIGNELGLDAERERLRTLGLRSAEVESGTYNFLGHAFKSGTNPRIHTVADVEDLEENLRQIEHAKFMSDYVIASLHCHELGGDTYLTAAKRSDVEELAEFAIDFAHKAIDAGADAVVAHGPQAPLGVEIYQRRPIFYGLGTFIFQIETTQALPEEAYRRYGLDGRSTPADFVDSRYAGDTRGHPADPWQWQQAFAVCSFDGSGLCEIVLHPIDLGFGQHRAQRGRPLLAKPEIASSIVERVGRLSKRYGTEVVQRGSVGVIRP